MARPLDPVEKHLEKDQAEPQRVQVTIPRHLLVRLQLAYPSYNRSNIIASIIEAHLKDFGK